MKENFTYGLMRVLATSCFSLRFTALIYSRGGFSLPAEGYRRKLKLPLQWRSSVEAEASTTVTVECNAGYNLLFPSKLRSSACICGCKVIFITEVGLY